MAVDMFLKIEGIPGESKDDTHKDEIAVISWSWGSQNTGSMQQQVGGGGAGKVQMQDFSFTHLLDKSSPKLQLANWTGTHIPSAVLVMRKAGDTQVEYVTYTFTDLIVSSIQTGGSQGEDLLHESVSMNFAQIELAYKEQKQDGSVLPEVTAGYNMKTMKKL